MPRTHGPKCICRIRDGWELTRRWENHSDCSTSVSLTDAIMVTLRRFEGSTKGTRGSDFRWMCVSGQRWMMAGAN